MIEQVLKARIEEYAPANAIEQENVLQELLQQYILASLSRAGLFSEAVFHGGTCLSIAYGMNRFSEDLDFLLKHANPKFKWQKYLERVKRDGEREGIHFEVKDRSKIKGTVKKIFLKTDSIGKILFLELPHERDKRKIMRVKLEIDTNPPEGSAFETRYITFPSTAAITTQKLESGFGMKLHALLCRRYIKGRDWYDFVWYISKKIIPDLNLMSNALYQQGPWAGKKIKITPKWLVKNLGSSISEMDWNSVRQDVHRFIPLREQDNLALWSMDFFSYQLNSLVEYLGNAT
jgi:predicted nucleotidyltransferase component of viral defense system